MIYFLILLFLWSGASLTSMYFWPMYIEDEEGNVYKTEERTWLDFIVKVIFSPFYFWYVFSLHMFMELKERWKK